MAVLGQQNGTHFIKELKIIHTLKEFAFYLHINRVVKVNEI